MIYFLWAFLFGILGISILCQSFKSSYKHILKFAGGAALLCIGILCFSRVELPVKYDYGKLIVIRVQKIYSLIFGKIQNSVS